MITILILIVLFVIVPAIIISLANLIEYGKVSVTYEDVHNKILNKR